MKIRSIIWLSIKEIKRNILLLFISFILFASILTAAFCVSSVSTNITKAFFDYIAYIDNSEGFSFELAGLQYSACDTVSDIPFTSLVPDDIIKNGTDFLFNGNNLSDYSVKVHFQNSDETLKILSGSPFTSEMNESTFVWISKELSEENHCKINSVISHKVSSDSIIDYNVAGIFEKTDEFESDMYVPFVTYYKAMVSKGWYVNERLEGTISDVREYKKISEELRSRGILTQSPFDEVLNALTIMNLLMDALFVIVTIAGIWTFSNICSIIINNRKGFIIHLQILGAKPYQTLMVYGSIIAVISLFAFVISMYFTNLFSVYLIDFAKTVYPELGKVEFKNSPQLIKGFFVFVITLCAILLRSYRKIRSTELISRFSAVQ